MIYCNLRNLVSYNEDELTLHPAMGRMTLQEACSCAIFDRLKYFLRF